MFKKIATFISVLFVPVTFAFAAPDGSLIKIAGNPAVYWLIDGVRHPFPLLSIYRSHFGNSFIGVAEVSHTTIATYPLGKNVRFKKGSLIKIQTDPRVYEVTDDAGAINWIPSEEEFLKRGFSFKQIQDVPDSYFVDYQIAVAPKVPHAPTAPPPSAQNFTTPTSTPSSTSTVVTAPVSPPALKLSIQNLIVKQKKTLEGARAAFTFSASLPSRGEIQLGYDSGTTSTFQLTSGTAFEKELGVSAGASYNYLVTLTAESTTTTPPIVTTTGVFMSYADVTVAPHPTAVKTGSPLLKSFVTVGGMTVTNNSTDKRHLTNMVLGFFAATNVTTNVNKTLSVYRYSALSLGDLLAQRNIANGTSILNSQNQQSLAFEDILAPGESKSYVVTLSNLDNVNLALIDGTETFDVKLVRLDALGDTSIGVSSQVIGSLLHKKP